jgi:hypothetical protein
MKRVMKGMLLLLIMSMLSGCSIYVRAIIPKEHGSIIDVIKKDPPVENTPTTPEPEIKPTPKPTPEVIPVPEPVPSPEPKPTLPEEPKEPESTGSQLKVSISPENPAKDGYVKLAVEGPANTPYTAVFHFRTRDSVLKGYCGVPFQVLLGGATIGYEVKVDVTALIEGQVHKASASFTPK